MQFLSMRGKVDGWGAIMPTAKEINYKLCARKMLMIDRITHVIPDGGAYGLGLIIGEKILERHHWYFPCHFKDDEAAAGSFVRMGAASCSRLHDLPGLHKTVQDFAFRPVPGVANKVQVPRPDQPSQGQARVRHGDRGHGLRQGDWPPVGTRQRRHH